MGFSNSTAASSAIYFGISEGKCRIRLKQATEGSITRTTKDGNVVHELVNDQFTGLLRAVEARETQYGKQWAFTFVDAPNIYILTIKYSSQYAKTLIQSLCNPALDITADITLRPYSFSPKDDNTRTITGVSVIQHGKKIERPYCSPMNPEPGKTQLPPLEELIVRGEKIYDDTKQMEFLASELNAHVISKLTRPVATVMPMDVLPSNDGGEDETLPF